MLAIGQYRDRHEVVVARIIIPSEHPDNDRFAAECAVWFAQPIMELHSDRYADTWDVWEKRRYLSGPQGALCTTELKKMVRQDFQRANDYQVFGYTTEERKRADQFLDNNPEVILKTPLIANSLSRADCQVMISRKDIAIPAMYLLGFNNNNCVPCVKATSPTYWNRVRQHFPDRFARMAELSRRLDVRLVRFGGERIFLDELPTVTPPEIEPALDCSLLCLAAEASVDAPS